jgi:hypothetical protein
MYNREMRFTGAAMAVLLVSAWAGAARADAPWLYRGVVLPRGEVAVDLGLGIGHQPDPNDDGITGLGMNLALAAGIAPGLELGVRTGFRFDNAGQATQADGYGRPFDTETYGTGFDTVANPEVHLTWSVARGRAGELGLEIAAYLPIESGTSFGMMFGLPIILRAGVLRIDTGVYVPVIFSNPTQTVFSVPLHFWIQATRTLWFGPLVGLRVVNNNGGEQIPLGFGVGSALNPFADLRVWFLFPDINQNEGARSFGAGVGLEFRFG